MLPPDTTHTTLPLPALPARALDLELSREEIETLDGLYRPRDVINDHVPKPMPRLLQGKSDG